MRRLLVGVTSLGAALLLCACPIYSDSSSGGSGPGSIAVTCQGTLEDCPTNQCTDACIPWQCTWVGDCPTNFACQTSVCVPAGADCSTAGCDAGYVCKLAGGTLSCVLMTGPSSDVDASSADGSLSADASRILQGGDASADAIGIVARLDATSSLDGAPLDAAAEAGPWTVDATSTTPDGSQQETGADAPARDGAPEAGVAESGADAATGTEAGAANECNADIDCASQAGRCVNGSCAAASSLCSDGTQCTVPGFLCVDGVCEPPCSGTSPVGCPVGYACDTQVGACSLNPDPCAGSGPSSCPSGSVCVEERCVAPCLVTDAGAVCALPDHVCVNGGCLPDESAKFACKNDGQSYLLANTCSSGSVCLHHDCYPQCDVSAEGGVPCADPSRTCKNVTVAAGTYAVCAPPDGLGSQCDMAAMVPCPSGHYCVDGFCK